MPRPQNQSVHRSVCVAAFVCGFTLCLQAQQLPDGVKDSQPGAERPPTPAESLAKITVPDGFKVTLFAGEPDVQQPIAMTFDDRGRLWVVECYSYPDWSKFEGKDRVVIFEDSDSDGTFDKRTVFLDNGKNLTGIELGFGGVWLCSTPHLVFVPDRNRDDKPDGPEEVVLDGWDYKKVSHNVFNGLIWGPDGWLYGCHGILADSLVGAPGTPDDQRTKLNCGVWRYHPTKKTFEVVCHGTTNPWGVDFDDHGEMFFTNCVIEHLWHGVPGGRYKRMYGQDFNPYSYKLMGPASDHLHWAGDNWDTIGSDAAAQTKLGGGHAHCGTMIYLGDNWPAQYRNGIFTANVHGTRINHDIPVRKGSGYVAKHAPDFLMANNPWFRGVTMKYGPDGGVYVADWNDLGECHDADGVLRSSGRIYKITYGNPEVVKPFDLSKASDEELAKLQLHKNEWYVRQSRRILQERAAAGAKLDSVKEELQKIVTTHPEATRKLRAVWALYVMEGLSQELLKPLFLEKEEALRVWAIRLSDVDLKRPSQFVVTILALANLDSSARVRLEIASVLKRMAPNRRWPIANQLGMREEDSGDPNIPRVLWYALEPAVPSDWNSAVTILNSSRIPIIREFIARRIVEADAQRGSERLITQLKTSGSKDATLDVIGGMLQGLKGRTVTMPPSWPAVYGKLSNGPAELRGPARLLGMALGDQSIATVLEGVINDAAKPLSERREAMEALIENHDPKLPALLQKFITDGELGTIAIGGLAGYDQPEIAGWLLDSYTKLSVSSKTAAVSTLASRPAFAVALLGAVEQGGVPRGDISTVAARQIANLGDAKLKEKLEQVWGKAESTSQEKKDLISRLKLGLTEEALAKADLPGGRAVFTRICASCHKLFGEGGDIGPELTGSDRTNLDYILGNTVDPSAVVGKDHQLTTVQTSDGRVVAGVVKLENDASLTVQSATEQVVIPKSQVASRTVLPVSMMPEGLLLTLKDEEIRDLVAYLAAKKQVELKK